MRSGKRIDEDRRKLIGALLAIAIFVALAYLIATAAQGRPLRSTLSSRTPLVREPVEIREPSWRHWTLY
jgi:hypothetical protein